MATNANHHPFHEIRQTAKPPASQTPAITLDVTQSQVTVGDSLFAEHPHGLDDITKTDSSTAATARVLKTIAITLVIRSCRSREGSAVTGVRVYGSRLLTPIQRGGWRFESTAAHHRKQDPGLDRRKAGDAAGVKLGISAPTRDGRSVLALTVAPADRPATRGSSPQTSLAEQGWLTDKFGCCA